MQPPPAADGNGFIAWLTETFPSSDADLPFNILLGRMIVAFVLGCLIGAIHRWTAAAKNRTPSFGPTLVLLTILIAMVVQVIGNSAAKAFTLVGALSIVRFRTNVRDTRDTAFVIFAVIVGMAVGSWHWKVALVGVPVMGVAAYLLARLGGTPAGRPHWRLKLRVAAATRPDERVAEVLPKWFDRIHLTASATAKQGTSVDLTYEVLLKRNLRLLDSVAALNTVEGVQNVELNRL